MPTEHLPVADTAASGADITVGAEGVVTFFLSTAAGGHIPFGAKVYIELKTSGGQYMIQDELNSSKMSCTLHAEPGTIVRARRLAGGPPVGVQRGA